MLVSSIARRQLLSLLGSQSKTVGHGKARDSLEGLQNDVHVWSYHSCTKIHPSLLGSQFKIVGHGKARRQS